MSDQITTFNSKPSSVTAVQLTNDNIYTVSSWCGGRVIEILKDGDPTDVYIGLDVPSLAGPLRADIGDYVIHNDRGVFRTQKADSFLTEYESATPQV